MTKKDDNDDNVLELRGQIDEAGTLHVSFSNAAQGTAQFDIPNQALNSQDPVAAQQTRAQIGAKLAEMSFPTGQMFWISYVGPRISGVDFGKVRRAIAPLDAGMP